MVVSIKKAGEELRRAHDELELRVAERTDILTALPEDRTTKQYLKRSARCLLEGVPDDWQGIERREEW